MIRAAYRFFYLVTVLTMVGRLLTTPGLRIREDRWELAVLTALSVREAVVVSQALWQQGRRRVQLWRKQRRARRASGTVKVKKDLVALAAQMFPDAEPWPWAEQAAVATLKASLRGVFALIPESVCVALILRLRWYHGVHCPRCGCREVVCQEVHYRRYFRRWQCPACSRARGKKVTFTDLYGTILEGSHLECRLWVWGMLLYVSGNSAESIAKELHVNRKTAQRMVRLGCKAH